MSDIDPKSFVRSGAGRGFISCSQGPGGLSPIYVIARAALRLLEAGSFVTLPKDYSEQALERIVMQTGDYYEEVGVSRRDGRDRPASPVGVQTRTHPRRGQSHTVAKQVLRQVAKTLQGASSIETGAPWRRTHVII